MKTGSLVEYLGGQDNVGRRLCPLDAGGIYEVSIICSGKFKQGWRPAIYLVETGNCYAHLKAMFREIQPPMEVNVNEFLKEEVI